MSSTRTTKRPRWTRRCVLAGALALAAVAACTEGAGSGPGGAPRAHRAKADPWAVTCMTTTQTATAPGSPGSPGVVDDAGMGSGSDGGPLPPDDGGMGSGSDGGMTDGGMGSGSGSDGGMMDCKGLDIIEPMLSLAPMGTAKAHVASVLGFTDQLVSATITGAGFAFMTPGCSAFGCDFSAMPKVLSAPFELTITCTATDGMAHGGLLVVQGAQGPSDTDSAILQCSSGGSMPLINVAPPSLDAGGVKVGTTKDLPFTITNTGTATLTYGLDISAATPEWTAPGSMCLLPLPMPPPPQCEVPPGGGSAVIPVRFAPTAPGPSTSSVAITSNAGSRIVDLAGTGLGSRIVVTDPASFDIDFGTIPRNSTATRPIIVTAVGNQAVSVDAASPGPPFSVTPPGLPLPVGSPMMFTASCSSAVETPQLDAAIGLSSTNTFAYAFNTMSIAVHCKVAKTQLVVSPSTFDFMELRKGSPRKTLPFTISNPGPFPADVASVRLDGAPAPLSISIEGSGVPPMLPVGGEIAGTLALETDADLDLAQTGPKLAIDVDNELLVYPVTGKITTPSAFVTPEVLELGSACAGTPVTGIVAMVNNGTARLLMEPPAIDGPFMPRFDSPTSYPAPLLANTMATLGVQPMSQAPAELEGMLTWAVDAPRSPFMVKVTLAYIDRGTAVSPKSVSSTPIMVGQMSSRYTVTLQNCNASPVVVTIDGVIASRGPAEAWQVTPRNDERALAPQDKLTIGVVFAPLRHGRHVAQIELTIDGEPVTVELAGDGIDPDFQRTSFYACGCTSPGGAEGSGGWPIVIAVALVVLRRRRRT